MEINRIINNVNETNEILDRIIDTLSNIDVNDYTQNADADRFDKFLDFSTKVENKVLNHKYVQSVNEASNSVLSTIGVYTMILALPLTAFAFVTGGVGTLVLAPIMLATGFTVRAFARRKGSILKKTSSITKKAVRFLKNKTRAYVRTKSLKKSTEQLTYKTNDISSKKKKIASAIQQEQQVSYLCKEVQKRITDFDTMYTNIINKAKSQDKSIVNSNMQILQTKSIDTILHLKVNEEQLKNITTDNEKLSIARNSILTQCEFAINAIKNSMEITEDMIYDRYCEIVKKNEAQQEQSATK